MGISIEKTIEIFQGMKKGIYPWYPEEYCNFAIDIMRKYQNIQQIKNDALLDIYMSGRMTGEGRDCWIRFKDVENIVNEHFREVLEDGRNLPSVTPQLSSGLDKNSQKLENPTTQNNLGVENDLVSSIVEKISEKVTETREEFIFETIRPYCENVVQMKISKRDLKQALLKYYGKNDLGVDCISRDDVWDVMQELWGTSGELMDRLMALPSVTLQEPKCKDCKWWKDSDGEYRRGVGAESQCPINRKEVFEGNGYCFLYEPQESEG